MPPSLSAEAVEGLWVVSRSANGTLEVAGWGQGPRGPVAVLVGRLEGRTLTLWGLDAAPRIVEVPEAMPTLGEAALRTAAGFLWAAAGRPRAPLDAEAARGAPAPFGAPTALPLDLVGVAEVEAPVLECRAFPSYEGDSICTGWLPRLIGNGADVSTCCFDHDQCFYQCPLEDGASCRGTDCILTCNAHLAGCCVDQGGDAVQCGLFQLVTDAAGGGGRNGCGRDKAIDFCDEQDFSAAGCEGERCVCTQCQELGGYDCSACTCVDECDPQADAPRCRVTGAGHQILRCRDVAFDDDEVCAKWQQTPCGPTEVCEVDVENDEARCVPADCPLEPACPGYGEHENTCRVDEGGPYYRECVADANGCLIWRRRYCNAGATTACVVLDEGPVCTGLDYGDNTDGGS